MSQQGPQPSQALFISATDPESIRKAQEKASAMIQYWSEMRGLAQAELTIAEGEFTHWKATVFKSAIEQSVSDGGKAPSDAKCEATYRAMPNYMDYVRAIANAQAKLMQAEGYYYGYKDKAQTLRSIQQNTGRPPQSRYDGEEPPPEQPKAPAKKPVTRPGAQACL